MLFRQNKNPTNGLDQSIHWRKTAANFNTLRNLNFSDFSWNIESERFNLNKWFMGKLYRELSQHNYRYNLYYKQLVE